MKLIVIDIDRLYWMTIEDRKHLNEQKICTLLAKDFGKKTLLGLPKGSPTCLRAQLEYEDAIFKLKDDDDALKFENKMFRKLFKEGKISWFRIGIILKRDKAIKILSKLLGIS